MPRSATVSARAARIGARGGPQLERDLEQRPAEALPQQIEDGVDARRPRRQIGGARLELARPHLDQVADRRDQELGLRREVMEQRAARHARAPLHLQGRGAGEAVLDQAVDRGVEQHAAHLVAPLRLRAWLPGRGLHHARGVPRRKQSVKTDC